MKGKVEIGDLLVNDKDGNLIKARFWERHKALAKFICDEPAEMFIYANKGNVIKILVSGRKWVKVL